MKPGDVIHWQDNGKSRIGLVLDIYNDIYDTELEWLYVQWPDEVSYVYAGMIKLISSVSNQLDE